MSIPTLSTWISRTAVTFRSRGDRLKALDNAIRDWNVAKTQANLEKIEQKLIIYIQAKGSDWRNDDRNAHHAISNLYQDLQIQLHGADEVELTIEELHHASAAFDTWTAARKDAAKRLFKDTQLVVKPDGVLNPEKLRGVSTSEAALSANNVRTIGSSAHTLIKAAIHSASGPAFYDEILAWCHASGAFTSWVNDMMTNVLPFVGIASNGYSAVSSGIKAAYNEYEKSLRADAIPSIEGGDPRAALDALGVIIDRDQRKNLDQAAMAAANTVVSAVLQALDITGAGAAASNAAFAIAKLAYRLRLIVRDFQEKKAANNALARPESIDLNIFKTSPILGCYMLVCAETSTLIVFLPGFGNVGWMDDVEDIVRNHLAPVQSVALSYLNNTRFDLVKTADGSLLEKRLYVNPGIVAKAKKLKDGGLSLTDVGRWAAMSPEDYEKRYGAPLPSDFRERITGRDRFTADREALERRRREVWDRFNNVKPGPPPLRRR